MVEHIGSFIIGIVLIVIGVIQYRGNISLLHAYHRNRVAKEDVKPMGKLVGKGSIIIGVGLCLNAIFNVIAVMVKDQIFSLVGTILLFINLIIGMGIIFYALKKYNKGIF